VQASEIEAILGRLQAMPSCLSRAAELLGPGGATRRPAEGAFSLVESIWHLADLEREGYAFRLERLLSHDDPSLPDFDGDRMAAMRNYQSLSMAAGLASFEWARAANIAVLKSISDAEWARTGRQEGVGRIRLADVPRLMLEHDDAHRAEIQALLSADPATRGESACG
jgi:hypothetical protein